MKYFISYNKKAVEGITMFRLKAYHIKTSEKWYFFEPRFLYLI